MGKITEFKIHFGEDRFADLWHRVAGARIPADSGDESWDLGTPSGALRRVLDHWTGPDYSWRRREEFLNGYPQYLTEIAGVTVHFFHIPAETAGAPAILMCHGWPDSFLRYDKTFPLLRDYNIVVPSMPGFAFSTLPAKGFSNNAETAEMWHTLMTGILGYGDYVVTGGDMGRGVACYLAANHPREVRGVHLTDVGMLKDVISKPDSELTEAALDYKRRAADWLRNEAAYIAIQSTKPRSLGYGLSDSPAGMAGWLVEKFHAWTDWERFGIDDLCDCLTLYWMCDCAVTSAMAYHGNSFTLPPMGKVTAPVGFAQFPHDVLPVPKELVLRQYDIIRYTEMPHGGHLTAMEEPEAFAADLSGFIGMIV